MISGPSTTWGQHKVMLLTYLHTAARRGELFELIWDDVDFDNRRIRLWTRKRKAGRECDWIPMTMELHDTLSWWYENRTFEESNYVFLCESKAPFSQEVYGKPFVNRQKWIRGLCQKAGVKPFGIHAIRHLTASILADAGYPITVIQAILRHKSANTTAKYLHNQRGMNVDLDDAFKRKSRPTTPARAEGRPILRLVKPAG